MPWRGSGKVSWVHSDATNKCCKYPVPGRKVNVKEDQRGEKEMKKKWVQEQRTVGTPEFNHWIHHWKNTRINWKTLTFSAVVRGICVHKIFHLIRNTRPRAGYDRAGGGWWLFDGQCSVVGSQTFGGGSPLCLQQCGGLLCRRRRRCGTHATASDQIGCRPRTTRRGSDTAHRARARGGVGRPRCVARAAARVGTLVHRPMHTIRVDQRTSVASRTLPRFLASVATATRGTDGTAMAAFGGFQQTFFAVLATKRTVAIFAFAGVGVQRATIDAGTFFRSHAGVAQRTAPKFVAIVALATVFVEGTTVLAVGGGVGASGGGGGGAPAGFWIDGSAGCTLGQPTRFAHGARPRCVAIGARAGILVQRAKDTIFTGQGADVAQLAGPLAGAGTATDGVGGRDQFAMFACQIAGEVVAMCFYDGFAVLVVSHAVFGPLGGGGGHEGTNAQQW
jgi:hypothetical protein